MAIADRPLNMPCDDPEGCKHFKAEMALEEENKKLKAEIERLWEAALEQHRWIPVSEKLPEDDSPHLFWLESGNVIQGIPSCELGKHNPPLTHKATHWKPIILP